MINKEMLERFDTLVLLLETGHTPEERAETLRKSAITRERFIAAHHELKQYAKTSGTRAQDAEVK